MNANVSNEEPLLASNILLKFFNLVWMNMV